MNVPLELLSENLKRTCYELSRMVQPNGYLAGGLRSVSELLAVRWLITSCRSANNIMPITFFLPAFIASSFYSA